MTTQILTANRLDDGVVVYLAEDGTWAERIVAAQVACDDDAAADLVAAGEIAEHLCQVIGAYLMKVADNGTRRPLGTRETIRSKGPSVLSDLGIGS
jgi:hypothetical protein